MTVLLSDPRVRSIPVVERGYSPLVDVRTLGIRYRGQTEAGALVRSPLAERLRSADASLGDGMRLAIVEGYRSAESQRAIIDDYALTLGRHHPYADTAELAILSSRYVAPLEVAPHVAGAAVDLTIVDANDRPLWMGTEIDATPEQSGGACAFSATNIDDEAFANRALLAATLCAVGLVNYPTEWWHWSYGDRYWALVLGLDSALFGPLENRIAA